MSFALTQLSGFGVVAGDGSALPDVRYVGAYAINFNNTTSASFTVNSGDLTLSGNNKELVIFAAAESPTLRRCTIDGVNAPSVTLAEDVYGVVFAGPRVGSSNVTVALTIDANSTETGQALVYEVVNARPMVEGFGDTAVEYDTEVVPRYAPLGSKTIGFGFGEDDTGAFTWTGLTENVDVDAGVYRMSGASDATNLLADTRDTITGASTDPYGPYIVSAIPETTVGVRGSLIRKYFRSVTAGTTITGTATDAPWVCHHTGAGSFKLVVFVSYENDVAVSSVTFNGNAMTLLGSVINTGASPDLRIYAYGIDVTQAAPSGSLVVTFASSVTLNCYIEVWRLYGVASVGTPGSQQGNATGASTTVNITAGGIIIGHSVRGAAETVTWTGLTEHDDFLSTAHRESTAFRWNCAAETGRTIQASGTSGQYAMIAIPFNA